VALHGLQPESGHEDEAELRQQRAAEWANRARNHFLVAYAGDLTDAQRLLLDAYVADKAVYETVYEARNRPTWLDIPLEAIARIGGA
jgi:maltokinase